MVGVGSQRGRSIYMYKSTYTQGGRWFTFREVHGRRIDSRGRGRLLSGLGIRVRVRVRVRAA